MGQRAPLSLRGIVALGLAAVLAACGGGEPSLTEYVDSINAASKEATARADQIQADGALTGELTPQQVEAGLQRVLDEIRIPLQEAVDEIEPPKQVASLHALLWTWHAEFITVEMAFADRIGGIENSGAGWRELSDSAEANAYRVSLAEGKQVCIDFQAELDATADRGVFEDVAWLPSELSEVVNAALGCESFPDDPDSIYRVPPP